MSYEQQRRSLSNSLAFMNHAQDSKGVLLHFAENEREKIKKRKHLKEPRNSETLILQSTKPGKQTTTKPTASFSVDVGLLELAVWVRGRVDRGLWDPHL